MKPSLQVRLSQHLALTPQLQQSIRLLQLSTLELHQEVQQMLEENPFLDVDDGDDELPRFEAPAERTAGADEAEGDGEGGEPLAEVNGQEFGATEREDWANGTEGDDFDGIAETPAGVADGAPEGDAGEPRDGAGATTSLQEHLRRQMLGMRLEGEDHAALEALIEALDDDGYQADPLETIAERLAAMLGV